MKKLLLVLSLSCLILSAACSNTTSTASTDQPVEQNKETATTPEASATTTPDAQSLGDPAKIDELVKLFPAQQPAKVATVSVTLSEMLSILGVMPVGVPESMNPLPAEFDKVTRVGSALKPDAEQIVNVQADVVIGPSSIKDSLEKTLGNIKNPRVYLPTDSYDDLKLTLEALGKVFGKEAEAEKFLTELQQKESKAIAASEGKTAPKVLFLFGSAESFMLMNETTYVGDLAKKLQATNVVSSVLKSTESYIPLDMEQVVTANPDIILLVSHGDPEAGLKAFEDEVKKNGAWEKMNAYKNHKVQALDYSLFGSASIQKAPDALTKLSDVLYQ
ncbi:ferrichrome ABC transporter substrate-binding protein [Paenibacillus selenitireducens]|uniref:Ferrichrome ABC transporter substrate-binding protein n=1 Tax=Paenibacillus selenitireducens TaxID=1324314 RepID=A0A1T2X8N9_9BACL|nr:ABC transporter substrate-binding protein [Paenibacillus selenitireducens]OPA76210.1 ferrichrome ABC transporter substrate-binding protein [Paenibacillus selenitireducens]